jgi:hypothetical protein
MINFLSKKVFYIFVLTFTLQVCFYFLHNTYMLLLTIIYGTHFYVSPIWTSKPNKRRQYYSYSKMQFYIFWIDWHIVNTLNSFFVSNNIKKKKKKM